MVFSYPEFHGKKGEDVEDFLEQMEVACISNQIQDLAQMLHLLKICLKGDTQVWSKAFEGALHRANPPVQLSWENLKDGLEAKFVKMEDPDKGWKEVQELRKRDGECVNEYIKNFSSLWENLFMALQP